jgi:Domain of unknown function (DUF4382)
MGSIGKRIALTLAVPFALAACDGSSPADEGGDGTARLSVFLTDAPGDVEAVWVDISDIKLRGDGVELDLLDESTGLIEITELVGTTQLLIDDAEIEAGVYDEVRLFLAGAVLESRSGKVFALGDAEHPDGLPATGNLKCPSCAQTGLKIKLGNGGVEFDGETALVLDFDVSQSFGHEAGRSGMWVMHPVIHATVVEDTQEGATLSGAVALASGVTVPACPAGTPRSIQDFVPTLTAATLLDASNLPLVRTGTVAADGSFAVAFLAPDTYTLGYMAETNLNTHELVWTATVTPASVTIASDDDDETGIAYTVTGVTCAAQ